MSRYHQLQCFFPTDDAPNYADHEFPVPGYLIIPSGYMRLVPKEHSLSTCMLEGEDMNEFWEEGINDTCKITSENSVLFLSKPCPTQETLSAVAATTSSSCTNPLSISLSVNTSVSLQIETTQNTQHQESLWS